MQHVGGLLLGCIKFLGIIFLYAGAAQLSPPREQIPPDLLEKIAEYERAFKTYLGTDCPSKKCFVRGCAYVAHESVDKTQESLLPGIPSPLDHTSRSQNYLTRVQCEFAFDQNLGQEGAANLVDRLQKQLSSGFTMVQVKAVEIPPVLQKEEDSPVHHPKLTWEALGHGVLPFLPWFLLLLLTTGSIILLIWVWRTLGRNPEVPTPSVELPNQAPSVSPEQIPSEQARLAILEAQIRKYPDQAQNLVNRMLRDGKVIDVAYLLHLFQNREISQGTEKDPLPSLIDQNPSQIQHRLHLGEVLKKKLFDQYSETEKMEICTTFHDKLLACTQIQTPKEEIFSELDQHIQMSALVSFILEMPETLGALTLSLLPRKTLHNLAPWLTQEQVAKFCRTLLKKTHFHPDSISAVCDYWHGVCRCAALPALKEDTSISGVWIKGLEPLRVLLPLLDPKERRTLFLELGSGEPKIFPKWMEEIFYPELLSKIPTPIRNEILLNCDSRLISAWSKHHVRGKDLEAWTKDAPPVLQKVLNAPTFAVLSEEDISRAESQLTTELQKYLRQREIKFNEII